jgi:hypothetical protein
MGSHCGSLLAFNSNEGLVVASTGFKDLIASTSPVSATIVVIDFSCSSNEAIDFSVFFLIDYLYNVIKP